MTLEALWAVRSAARIAWSMLPESLSWSTRFVRLVLGPAITGVFYLAISTGGGTEKATSADAVAAGLAAGAVASTVAVAGLMATDRFSGTLPLLLMARSRLVPWAVRFAVTASTGVLAATMAMVLPIWLAGGLPAERVLAVGICIVVTAPAACGVGFLLGAVSLSVRDALMIANIAEFVLPPLIGAVASVRTLPNALEWLAQSIPLTHVIQAARQASQGGWSGAYWVEIGVSLAVGAVWVVAALAFWLFFERRSRASGSIEGSMVG